MPFQSEKQRRFLHANHPEIAKRWEKEYAHGGILDINESEEIISDDGNDIELTDYNAAFDDPNDLSTGVKSLFQAKDGGTPVVKKSKDGSRQGYWGGPPGGGETSQGSGAAVGGGGSSHDRGGQQHQKTASTPSSPSGVPGGGDKTMTYTAPRSPHYKEEEETKQFAIQEDIRRREEENPGRDDLLRTYTKRMTDIQDEIKEKWRRKIDPTLWEKIKDMPTLSFVGIIGAVIKDIRDVKEMKKDMEMLASLGLDKGHPSGTDTAFSNLQDYFAGRKLASMKEDDTGGPDGPPSILNPVTLEVDEEYAQGDYDFDSMSNWNAMKQKQALNAQLQEQWENEMASWSANSGGLANLFRVKNQ